MKLRSQHTDRLLRLVLLPALIGALAGLGAIAFAYMLEGCQHYLLGGLAGYYETPPGGERALFEHGESTLRPWLIVLLPCLGGLVSGLLIYGFAPETAGHGTDNAIDAYHNKEGKVRKRVPFFKAITAAITIGTGGSGGREGPIAQIGSGVGSMLSGVLGFPQQYRRVLLISGLGAGVGSIFHAPMAGALFASEVLYREMEFEAEVLVPATVASIVGYSVFSAIIGQSTLFLTPDTLSFHSLAELIPYTILALCLAVGAFTYAKFFYLTEGLFKRMPGPPHLRPAVGGLVVGLVAWFGSTQAMAGGYGVVQEAIDGQAVWTTLLLIAGLKIVTTSFTIGSGGSGGLFGPSVVIGGALGGAIGFGLQGVMPDWIPTAQSYAIVGMAGFFAAAAKTPFSTVIMVSEMTGSYDLLVPTLWVSVIAFVLLRRTTIYAMQPDNRLDSPVHLGEMFSGTLSRISVRKAMGDSLKSVLTIPRDMPLKGIFALFAEHTHDAFPVVGKEGRLLGVVDNHALRACAGETEYLDFLVAEDLAQPVPMVTPSDTLLLATQLMAETSADEILVVDNRESPKILGMLYRNQIMTSYAKYSARK